MTPPIAKRCWPSRALFPLNHDLDRGALNIRSSAAWGRCHWCSWRTLATVRARLTPAALDAARARPPTRRRSRSSRQPQATRTRRRRSQPGSDPRQNRRICAWRHGATHTTLAAPIQRSGTRRPDTSAHATWMIARPERNAATPAAQSPAIASHKRASSPGWFCRSTANTLIRRSSVRDDAARLAQIFCRPGHEPTPDHASLTLCVKLCTYSISRPYGTGSAALPPADSEASSYRTCWWYGRRARRQATPADAPRQSCRSGGLLGDSQRQRATV
jgi:hypothetical protein